MPLLRLATRTLLRPGPLIQRRAFHPEPRSFQTSPHAAQRAFWRWTIQGIATPFAVAYACEMISNRSEGGDSSWKLDLPQIEAGLMTEPMKIRGRVWGQMREDARVLVRDVEFS